MSESMSDGCKEAALIVVVELPVGDYTFEISDAHEETMEFVIHAYNTANSHADHAGH